MSTRTLTARHRTAGRARPQRARRRGAALLVAAALLGVAAALLAPLLQHAVREARLPLRHEDIIRQQARDKHLDPALIAGVIYAESKFRPRTSRTGAKGLMQIQPATARFIAHRSGATRFELRDLATPQVNIAYGSYYLRYLIDRYGGDEVLAVAAYNGGETNLDRWIADSGRRGQGFSADQIPFTETRAYVRRVQRARDDYRRTYRRELGLYAERPVRRRRPARGGRYPRFLRCPGSSSTAPSPPPPTSPRRSTSWPRASWPGSASPPCWGPPAPGRR